VAKLIVSLSRAKARPSKLLCKYPLPLRTFARFDAAPCRFQHT